MREEALCAALARWLDYPGESEPPAALDALDGLPEEVGEALSAFVAETRELTTEAREDLYVRTFDFSPVCAPYVGVHLFGEDGYKRSRLLAELAGAYARAGASPTRELPDHLGLILRRCAAFTDEEWQDLVRYCLVPALDRMTDALQRGGSPYRHVLEALRRALSTAVVEETSHA